MFVLKLIIGIGAIVLAVKIAKDKSDVIKNEYLYFNGLVNFCDKVLSDLSFKKSKLEYLLNLEFNSKDLNLTLSTFKNEKIIFPAYLSKDEEYLIIDFLTTLGKSDVESQIKNVIAFKKEFIKISNEKYERYTKTNKLFVKLGFVSGLLIFILVI
ncbi:MAG: hypothetical protein IKA85_06360 [Clostridia bacterium]|nr:hypothetical protein [Clostridia bacterium]